MTDRLMDQMMREEAPEVRRRYFQLKRQRLLARFTNPLIIFLAGRRSVLINVEVRGGISMPGIKPNLHHNITHAQPSPQEGGEL